MAEAQIVVLIDTPNIHRRTVSEYGLGAREDYRLFRDAVKRLGSARSEAVVNDGVPKWFARELRESGYVVTYSHAQDCDEMLISRAVLLHDQAEHFVIASGDHKNFKLIKLLKQLGKRVVVAGIPGSIHRSLYGVADGVIDFPVRLPNNPNPPPLTTTLARVA